MISVEALQGTTSHPRHTPAELPYVDRCLSGLKVMSGDRRPRAENCKVMSCQRAHGDAWDEWFCATHTEMIQCYHGGGGARGAGAPRGTRLRNIVGSDGQRAWVPGIRINH